MCHEEWSYIEFPVNHFLLYTCSSSWFSTITYLDPADFHRFQPLSRNGTPARYSFTYSPALIQQGSPEQRTKLQGTQRDTIYSVRSGFPDPTVFSFGVGKPRKIRLWYDQVPLESQWRTCILTDEECFLLECWIRDPPKPSPLLTSWILPVCIAMVDSGGAEVPSEVRKTRLT